MKLFLQKNAKFSNGAPPPTPVPQAAGGFAPRPPKQPPIANFWLRACYFPLPGPNHRQLNFNTKMQNVKCVLT